MLTKFRKDLRHLLDWLRWTQFQPRQKWAIVLYAAVDFGPYAALFAAFMHIGSIMIIGPLLAGVGFAFALMTWTLNSWRALIFGLSAPAATAVIALLVGTLPLGREGAKTIVVLMLLTYALLLRRLSKAAWHVIVPPLDEVPYRKWTIALPRQFSLKRMLRFTAELAVIFLLTRWALMLANISEFPPFTRFALLVLILCGATAYCFATYARPHEHDALARESLANTSG